MRELAAQRYGPEEFQHESDRVLIDELLRSPAVEKLKGFLAENRVEETYRYYYASSHLRVTADMAPHMAALLEKVAPLFGLESLPTLYLTRDYETGAVAGGVSEPFILLSTDLLTRLDQRRLRGVLGAQCGAIAAGHGEMHYLLWFTDYLMHLLPVQLLPGFVGEAVSGAVAGGLNKWAQFREYTTDRAFFLATGDYPLAVEQIFLQRMGAKYRAAFAFGTEEDRYREQAEAFLQDTGVSNVVQAVSSLGRDEAWLPRRYEELRRFQKERGGE